MMTQQKTNLLRKLRLSLAVVAMDDALAKIRPHTTSTLAHQKTPATLLIAIESTFEDQKTEPTPTAFFAALLTALDGTIQKDDIGLEEGKVLPAELYLLSLVSPFVPQPVIRTHLNTLISLTAPLFPALLQHAPPLRSQLSLFNSVFHALDRSLLDVHGVRQSFSSILNLCADSRPKVRKKAADVVKDVLAAPPAPLALHPYAERTADWITSALLEINAGPSGKGKAAKHTTPGIDSGIHVLAFLRPVLAHLPPSTVPPIANLLLTLPRLGNAYLSQLAYSILSDLFAIHVQDDRSIIVDQIPEVLKVVLSSPPSKSDSTLAPAWVKVLGDAMTTCSTVNSEAYNKDFTKVWKAVWALLDASDPAIRRASATTLDVLSKCISPQLIAAAVNDKDGSSTIRKIIAQVTKALDSVAYAQSVPEMLAVVSSLVGGLGHREALDMPTAAETLLLPLIQHVGKMRTQKGFGHKDAVDSTLTMAMRVIGPEAVLRVLPLNLEPDDRAEGVEPRAFLLPLLSHPHPSSLAHFVGYFVPLSERMFDLQQKAEIAGRQAEAKMWNVLIGQVWGGLVGYCHAPTDLKKTLTPAFSQMLSQLLYSQTELRPAILRALKVLVDVNVASTSNAHLSARERELASANVAFLSTQAESWLAVLFNVFGTVSRDSRAMVGDVISSWAGISPEKDINGASVKVTKLFQTSLASSQNNPTPLSNTDATGKMAVTALDLLLLLLPRLSSTDSAALLELCLSSEALGYPDNAVQKRAYKVLGRLVESKKVSIDAEVILKRLDGVMDRLAAAAKKDRFSLLTLLISELPSSSMHVIPSIIPEAVLGTKEPSEKARAAAFEVILAMGWKMSEGGVVQRSLVDGMDEDGVGGAAAANLEEFMTMIAGGLAGASPHMIGATVVAISRLVFEFKDKISEKMHDEIFTTLQVFLGSSNREIVKSVLGFIKLAIHSLPPALLRPHLPTLVPALLAWSHDHKNHFKMKVRHIFERMLRRFTWDEVYGCTGGQEAGKVLVNIKKRKERAKRRRAGREEMEEDELEGEKSDKKTMAEDAFEDVLYGSESELEDSGEEERTNESHHNVRKKVAERGVRLRVDNDEPMDLLQGVAARISTQSARRRKPGQDASHFKTDEETGKMIIDDESDGEVAQRPAEDVEGTAYRENLVSVDGFTRGAGGRVKFHKDTKKRQREEADAEDIEMAEIEADSVQTKAKTKVKVVQRIGHEFKAKRAGGDVKKGGLDPYAYVPLSQASKRVGKRNRIGIAGK